MADYNQLSRYYECDTSEDIPQYNMLKTTYSYDTLTVLANETGRLDLVSYRVYNTPVHWWIIARFNAIINQEEVQAGMKLKIPRLL